MTAKKSEQDAGTRRRCWCWPARPGPGATEQVRRGPDEQPDDDRDHGGRQREGFEPRAGWRPGCGRRCRGRGCRCRPSAGRTDRRGCRRCRSRPRCRSTAAGRRRRARARRSTAPWPSSPTGVPNTLIQRFTAQSSRIIERGSSSASATSTRVFTGSTPRRRRARSPAALVVLEDRAHDRLLPRPAGQKTFSTRDGAGDHRVRIRPPGQRRGQGVRQRVPRWTVAGGSHSARSARSQPGGTSPSPADDPGGDGSQATRGASTRNT